MKGVFCDHHYRYLSWLAQKLQTFVIMWAEEYCGCKRWALTLSFPALQRNSQHPESVKINIIKGLSGWPIRIHVWTRDVK